jgi:hypothetical protein
MHNREVVSIRLQILVYITTNLNHGLWYSSERIIYYYHFGTTWECLWSFLRYYSSTCTNIMLGIDHCLWYILPCIVFRTTVPASVVRVNGRFSVGPDRERTGLGHSTMLALPTECGSMTINPRFTVSLPCPWTMQGESPTQNYPDGYLRS